MAVFWNIHLTDGFDRIFGLHWRDWWTGFVDDIGVHGATYDQCALRCRLLEAALQGLGKPLSNKFAGDRIKPSMVLAGLQFSHGGVCLSDNAVSSL